MGTIIDKLNRQKELLRTIGETLYLKKNHSSSGNVDGFSNLKEISENLDNFRYLEPNSSSCLASQMLKGATAYDSFGSLIKGTFQPYSGITASASDVASGKYFRDSNGVLTIGTHECSESTKDMTIQLVNNSVHTIYTSSTAYGPNNFLKSIGTGETYKFEANTGDFIVFLSNVPIYNKSSCQGPYEFLKAEFYVKPNECYYDNTTFNMRVHSDLINKGFYVNILHVYYVYDGKIVVS